MLNIIDAWLTLAWIKIGIAFEANPLMAYALSIGDAWFIGTKIFAVAIACGALCMLRDYQLAKRLSIYVCIVYIMIMIVHGYGFILAAHNLS